jgi:tRNA-splicing ligase RtcB
MLDSNARLQAEKTARLPIVDRVALMPDAHLGMGATVGSVIGTRDAIIPAAVGVDIGCGMAAVRLNMNASELPDDLDRFKPMIAKAIPAGVGQGHEVSTTGEEWLDMYKGRFSTDLDSRLKNKISTQFGTLGSGNHFFEICLDEDDRVWMVLHSGSRGIGNILATSHIKEAKRVAKEKGYKLEDQDLAYLESADAEFGLYIDDMLACQDYAMANRQAMLDAAYVAFRKFLGDYNLRAKERINCHHNFTELEQHGNDRLWVTRKGAIRARIGDRGIIPGSMGADTYIISGRGEPVSYQSCSHGAGRLLSRSAAKKKFDGDDLRAMMGDKVWQEEMASSLVDEIPSAYKPIAKVMEDQRDLVNIEDRLTQVFNYKGT